MAAGWAAGYEIVEAQEASVTSWLLSQTDPRSGDVVLDIAAGTGGLSHAVARRVAPDGRVICSDFAREMVEAARTLGEAKDVDNIEYRTLDAERMELDDESVDIALSRKGFMTMADPGLALTETHRVLRPGGSLAFSVVSGDGLFFTLPVNAFIEHGHLDSHDPRNARIFSMSDPQRVRELTDAAGFHEVEIEAVKYELRFDEDSVWQDVVDRNARLSSIIAPMEPEELDSIRTAVVDAFAAYQSTDGDYLVPAESLAVIARRPE